MEALRKQETKDAYIELLAYIGLLCLYNKYTTRYTTNAFSWWWLVGQKLRLLSTLKKIYSKKEWLQAGQDRSGWKSVAEAFIVQ